MTLTAIKTKLKVIGVNQKGYRIGSDHHNHNPKITDVVVDALRDLHEDKGIGYSTLAKIFNLNKHTIAKICRYERRADYPDRFKTIEVR
tara:strand:- start:1 stop:267 length:267 start_codon:yes stop_codon:yes gene_type:complete